MDAQRNGNTQVFQADPAAVAGIAFGTQNDQTELEEQVENIGPQPEVAEFFKVDSRHEEVGENADGNGQTLDHDEAAAAAHGQRSTVDGYKTDARQQQSDEKQTEVAFFNIVPKGVEKRFHGVSLYINRDTDLL